MNIIIKGVDNNTYFEFEKDLVCGWEFISRKNNSTSFIKVSKVIQEVLDYIFQNNNPEYVEEIIIDKTLIEKCLGCHDKAWAYKIKKDYFT